MIATPIPVQLNLEPDCKEHLLGQVLSAFVGSTLHSIREASGLTDVARSALGGVVLSPSADLERAVRRNGFTHTQKFIVIPSRRTPRWLIPAQGRPAMLAAMQIYEPHKSMARLLKKTLIGVTQRGWTNWFGPEILVATKGRSALEGLVDAVAAEPTPVFALSVGRQAAVRKLTVQVMRQNGDILGYIKLPLTEAATERVRNEASVLERLGTFPSLRPHIPRLLYAGNCNGTYVLFQGALQGTRGPTTLSAMHRSLLAKMQEVHTIRVPGQTVIHRVAVKWETVAPILGAEWEGLAQEALRRASRELEGKSLRCGVVHGDFAPWNTRVLGDRILLFDWESASWEAPTSWDTFHFHVQTSSSLRRNGICQLPKRESNDEISYLLYLLNSAVQFLAEENQSAVALCKTLLVKTLQGRQAWISEQAVAA